MSTGFWFVQPTQPSRDFLAAFIDLELHWRNWQTDQRLWNEARLVCAAQFSSSSVAISLGGKEICTGSETVDGS